MIKIKNLKKFLEGFVWFIGKNSTTIFFVLFSWALIIGGFIFYKYSFLAERSEPQVVTQPLEFKETLYQKILEEWQTRQRKFEEVESEEYPDLFRSLPVVEEIIPEESEELTE
jgi:hypothetical protein